MLPALKFCTALAILSGAASAQISNLSTNTNGADLYFVSDLSQRGSGQPSTNKVFLLRNTSVALIEQSSGLSGYSTYIYNRTALSATGSIRAINRGQSCGFGTGNSPCLYRDLATTEIQTPSRSLSFNGYASLSANGRFAALYGNTNRTPGLIPRNSVRLVTLESGQAALIGPQAMENGQFVADDGTVLVAREGGIRLIGPSQSTDLVASKPMNRALLSADASRIVYDVQQYLAEIRVIDVATGVDRSFGPGGLPMLASDGRRFSYLNAAGGSIQVWLGDAVIGYSRRLSNEPEGILDQTITGDGGTVIAATRMGRLLSINTSTGVVKQVLGAPNLPAGLLTAAVPGSYNEIRGIFPAGFAPEIRVGSSTAAILGPSPRGLAIQIPWDIQPDRGTSIVVRSSEPAWERVLSTGVSEAAGVALPVGAGGPGGPAYYAIHEDWSGFVTTGNPALPGEVIHMYGTGYGPVDGSLATGQPTPTDRLYRMTSSCVWQAIGVLNDPRPFEAVFAGLAPGLVGLYQFDFRIPRDWPYRAFNAYCQLPSTFLPTAAIEVRP